MPKISQIERLNVAAVVMFALKDTYAHAFEISPLVPRLAAISRVLNLIVGHEFFATPKPESTLSLDGRDHN